MSTIIYGEQGSGKSANAERLKRIFGATSIIDPWTPGKFLPKNSIAFTNVPYTGAIHINDALKNLEPCQESKTR